ncbi:MAG: T9SS type A sorting domain-containing protein, partial [Candidatus Zixiibacteriota bacterium]
YPNPFNAVTNISYSLAEAGNVSLKVYDISGRLVETLVNGPREAGEHIVTWDASKVSSGVYFYKLSAGDYTLTKKMNLLR